MGELSRSFERHSLRFLTGDGEGMRHSPELARHSLGGMEFFLACIVGDEVRAPHSPRGTPHSPPFGRRSPGGMEEKGSIAEHEEWGMSRVEPAALHDEEIAPHSPRGMQHERRGMWRDREGTRLE